MSMRTRSVPSTLQKKAIYTNISQFLFTFHQIPCKLGEHNKTSLGLRWEFGGETHFYISHHPIFIISH